MYYGKSESDQESSQRVSQESSPLHKSQLYTNIKCSIHTPELSLPPCGRFESLMLDMGRLNMRCAASPQPVYLDLAECAQINLAPA